MINTLENNTEISTATDDSLSSPEARDGEPPQSNKLTPEEAEFLRMVNAIITTKDHVKRKKLNDSLFPHNASVRLEVNLLHASNGVRAKLNGTLHPDADKIINVLQRRINKESEKLRELDT